MFLAGLSYKFIGTVLAIAIPCVIIFISIAIMPNPPFLQEYQQERILAWIYPEEYSSTTGFQQQNFECLQRIQKDGAARLMHGTPSFKYSFQCR